MGLTSLGIGKMGGRYRPKYINGRWSINHILVYGQSLSVGQNPTPTALTVAQNYGNLMLNDGLRAQPYDVAAETLSSFVPLVSQISPLNPGTFGETPAGGFTDMVSQLILAENGQAALDAYKLAASCPGYGSTAIAGLSAGTAPYAEYFNRVERVAELAYLANRSCAVAATHWWQGETDYINGTTRATYLSALNTLVASLSNRAKQINPQSFQPLFIIAQLASHLYTPTPTPTIALAQMDAHLADGINTAISHPQYIGDHVTDWHSTAASLRWGGAYGGLTFKRRVYDGVAGWNGGIKITGAVRNGGGIDVTTDAIGQLTIDTTWVTALADGNYGIQVVDSGGTAVTVTGVTVVGTNGLRVACAAGGGAGSVLRAGWAGTAGQTVPGRVTGARTNIRDTYGASLTFQVADGDTRPMHRWLAISEVPTT